MQCVCPDKDKVYQYKLMTAITLPRYPPHAGEIKQWIEVILNTIRKFEQSGSSAIQTWIKFALYPGTDVDVLLEWLQHESQGMPVLDHFLVSCILNKSISTHAHFFAAA